MPCADLNGKELQTRGDTCIHMGFPGGTSGKEPPANAGYMRHRFNPWVGKMPREEGMQPLQYSSHHKESDTIEST